MFLVTGPVTRSTSAWRGEATNFQPEPLEVVKGVVERMNLEFAAIARAGIHLPDGETPPELPPCRAVERFGKLGEARIGGRGRPFGDRSVQQILEDESAHRVSLKIVT